MQRAPTTAIPTLGPLALLLAALAGYVDAAGFLASGGYFVSFMSGNSTRAGVGMANAAEAAGPALLLIACFVAGTVGGALLRRMLRGERRDGGLLLAVAAMLALAALSLPMAQRLVALGLLAAAMGALNLASEADGEVRVGLTYMTGTLVKLGLRIAEALGGGARWGWLPFLALWAALVAGGVLGALVWLAANGVALWLAAGFAATVALARRNAA